MAKKCPKCGSYNLSDAKFCETCGTNLKGVPDASASSQGSNGIFTEFTEWFNKQSTGIKAALGIVGIFCLGLILIVGITAMIPNNNTTTSNTDVNTTQPTTTTNANTQAQPQKGDVTVHLIASDPWTGDISDNSGSRSIQGNGNDEIDLGSSPGVVSISFQKSTNSTNALTVNLMQGDNVVQTQTTTAAYGGVSVSNTF